MKGLRDKVVLITGGNSGIGKATALAFAEEGTKVSICARRQKEGEAVENMVKDLGGEAIFIKTDVTKNEDIIAALNKTVEAFGSLDFAFNNAGVGGSMGPLHLRSDEDWNETIAVNLTAVFRCMKYEIGYMLEHGGGRIVNMSSMGGLTGMPTGAAPYGASKHGVIGLTKCAALEYAQQDIRVNAICPAVIETPMIDHIPREVWTEIGRIHPVGRMGTPEEVAGMVVYLCCEEAAFMTGGAIPIDGGAYAG